MKRVSVLVCAALLPLGTLAQDASLSGQRLAASCANCHGTFGNPPDQSIPPLAGMPASNLIAGMKAYREGSRPATVMQQLAKGFTEEQVKLIADFFAAQKPDQKREAQ